MCLCVSFRLITKLRVMTLVENYIKHPIRLLNELYVTIEVNVT